MVNREKVIKGLEYCLTPSLCTGCVYRGEHCTTNMYTDAIKLLKEQPEIVRCKDCKHAAYVAQVGTLPYITCRGVDHELDWFCADGERW